VIGAQSGARERVEPLCVPYRCQQALLVDTLLQLQLEVNAPGVLRALDIQERRVQVIQFGCYHYCPVVDRLFPGAPALAEVSRLPDGVPSCSGIITARPCNRSRNRRSEHVDNTQTTRKTRRPGQQSLPGHDEFRLAHL
jgi:hypothetical protein